LCVDEGAAVECESAGRTGGSTGLEAEAGVTEEESLGDAWALAADAPPSVADD
jgi:hypothetical protein